MNISLPDSLKDFVQDRVAQKDFSNAGDSIHALIRSDKVRFTQKRLEQLLLEGLESSLPEAVDEQFREQLDQPISR